MTVSIVKKNNVPTTRNDNRAKMIASNNKSNGTSKKKTLV